MKEQAFRADAREAKGLHDGSITRVVRVVDKAIIESYEQLRFMFAAKEADGHSGVGWYCGEDEYPEFGSTFCKCPFGVVGDRLFVEEEWRNWEVGNRHSKIVYRADFACDPGFWYAAADMPRWASRTLLDVTDVRVVRAQEVTGQDMRAAGMTFGCRWCTASDACAVREVCEHPRDEFRELVGRAVFDANRWLWLATVQKVEA